MDKLPIDCHNCFSHKREFYVYLQCKHFLCLSCCLCLANFQNMTIRCCHRNTKMSTELQNIVVDELEKRKNAKGYSEPSQNIQKYQIVCERILENHIFKRSQQFPNEQSLYEWNSVQKDIPLKTKQKTNSSSHLVEKLKQIQSQNSQTINQTSRVKTIFSSLNPQPQSQIQNQLQNQRITFQQSSKQQACPTFKCIKEQNIQQRRTKAIDPQTKQNYICWKNHDTTKDRIIAKLNFHQQKMNNLIKEHYYW